MLDRVMKMKRRTKGAISIFLMLIFVASYVLAGLLVDGGRYRMAQVMAESALDSANESVLSYYNQMLFDLYGIFAVDSSSINLNSSEGAETLSQISSVLKNYVDQTLSITDVDYSSYSTLLTNWIMEQGQDSTKETKYFDDYDFEVTIKAGSSVTLASTDYVENQIIEHMKYRAPIEIALGEDSFLGKLIGIIELKDRMVAAKDQIVITNSYKSLFQEADTLIQDLKLYNEKVIAFCHNPEEMKFSPSLVPSTGTKDANGNFNIENTVDLYDLYGKELDDQLNEIGNQPIERIEGEEESDEEEDENIQEEYREKYEEEVKKFYDKIMDISVKADGLHTEANDLRDRVERINNRYNEYIGELEGKLKEKPEDENYRTVYEPVIAQAKAKCGEILKNIDLILNARQYEDAIYKLGQTDSFGFYSGLSGMIDNRCMEEEVISPYNIRSALNDGDSNFVSSEISGYMADLEENLKKLMSQASYYYKCNCLETVEAKEEDFKIENKEEDKKKEEFKDLNAEDLKVNYTHASDLPAQNRDSLPDIIDTSNGEKVMDMGIQLVDGLVAILKEARDSIYVNEYIMTTFPNVVDSKDMPSEQTDLMKKRAEYAATLAEVEYILTGNPDSDGSVLTIEAELLGIRTIFNSVAIFTDSAKRNQASAIASAVSGPFAPVVTIVLLIAWAVAESVLDVVELREGSDEIPLLKKSGDWMISIEGAINKCIDTITGKITDIATDLLSNMQEQVKEKTNGMIYDIYNTTVEGMDSITTTVTSELDIWTSQAKEATGNQAGMNSALDQMNTEVKAGINEVKTAGAELSENVKDQAVKIASESIDLAFDKTETSMKNGINGLSTKVKEDIKKNGLVPGQVENGVENTKVTLNYGDYMRIFLLMMNQQTKVERIQSLIQANMRYGGSKEFKMEDSAVAVWADMECSIRYLFMTNAIVPKSMKKDGRLTFTVHSARAY